MLVRLLQYPSLKGQGHDCIVLHKWLSHVCEEIQRDDLEPGLNVRAGCSQSGHGSFCWWVSMYGLVPCFVPEFNAPTYSLPPKSLDIFGLYVSPNLAQDPQHYHLFDALKYTADSGNRWFRSLYQFGVWMPGNQAGLLSDAAFGLTETQLVIQVWELI